jgi:uracil-DNA glycosylase
VRPCGTALPDRDHPVFVLGAYPSALHVRWTPPDGFGAAVSALPVDNEPTPFWDGDPEQAQALFETWRAEHFRPEWGSVRLAALNGPSGRDLENRWLRPLGWSRTQAFITDCLPTARASRGVATRLADRYRPFAEVHGAPAANLGPHPSEDEIVAEALDSEATRIAQQLRAAGPDLVITLGNAAARVLAGLAGLPERSAVLRPETYGEERHIEVDGHRLRWQALVHPATPRVWAERHTAWARDRTDD